MSLIDWWPWRKRQVQNDGARRISGGLRPASGYSRAFMAATSDRLVADMPTWPRALNWDLRLGLGVMRARSRHLFENSDYAKNYGRVLKRNVIGAAGIRLQSKAMTANGRMDDLAVRIIEAKFADWSRRGICTFDGRLSFAALQRLALLQVARDGEVIIQRLRGAEAGNAFGYALQFLAIDRLDERLNIRPDGAAIGGARGAGTVKRAAGTEIRMGVERIPGGAPVAYHLLSYNPADDATLYQLGERAYRRVPASDILHLFLPEDGDQVRGFPWAHTAIRRLQILSGYEEAELTAARMAASKMGFYQETEADADGLGEDQNEKGEPIQDFEPGTFERLPRGLEFQAFDPQHPTTQFGEFVKHVLRGGSAGLGVSYHSASNDLSDANYSSLRQGALDEQYEFESLQSWLIDDLCDVVYRDWLDQAMLAGVLAPLNPSGRQRYQSVKWQPRGFSWVDPEKEINAEEKALALKIRTRTEACADRGRDFEEVLQELQAEERLAAQYGIDLSPPASAPMQPATAPAGKILTASSPVLGAAE